MRDCEWKERDKAWAKRGEGDGVDWKREREEDRVRRVYYSIALEHDY